MISGIGISGMGRIGRLLIRNIMSDCKMKDELKAINSTYPAETIAHLLKYDSVHGTWDAEIRATENTLIINESVIQVAYSREPERIPWKTFGVDLVIDSTGKFNHRTGASRHLEAGASTVLITAPGTDMDQTIVMGVNQHDFDPDRDAFLSAASCTTNCVVPILKVIDDAFSIKRGWVTTVHAFTSDQNHLDNPHKDLRRARACTQSIIPTTTGIGKALMGVLPHLSTKMEGTAIRVPTQDVSLVDLTIELYEETSIEEVKKKFEEAANGSLFGIIDWTETPLVSSDYIGCQKSAVIDGPSVKVVGNHLKILAWYDNEWAYATRVIELANYVQKERRENGKLRKSS
ncbi:type I glyceraldehyde-3-phosphate dehydrogenase [Radiobacillus kanasensis]|uniref:type I glyceraldehyde-3-phosphate dehydrogenase n=1 Tax=Radiobacillus kanasensis TaxID=2844358 RepID=UPI001E6406BE|nr:type I glyceraldehyde-3-phosphate dehydrogenase [Radiobacillus kanasensis]UFU00774.1 type I glyceraldehyde-3-phosphate dehydrogenase [Radiobacillus kanasensis]